MILWRLTETERNTFERLLCHEFLVQFQYAYLSVFLRFFEIAPFVTDYYARCRYGTVYYVLKNEHQMGLSAN